MTPSDDADGADAGEENRADADRRDDGGDALPHEPAAGSDEATGDDPLPLGDEAPGGELGPRDPPGADDAPNADAGDLPGAGDPAAADPSEEFDHARRRALEAVQGEDVESMYVGLVTADGHSQFYFANDVDESELREVAATQLGMLHLVLAEQSEATLEEVAELGVERAKDLDLP